MMNRLHTLSIALLLIAVLSGCAEPKADIESKQSYEHDGLSFDYPANWNIEKGDASERVDYTFITTPGSAIIAVEATSLEYEVELIKFAQISIQELKSEIPKLLKVSDKVALHEKENLLGGKSIESYQYEFNIRPLGTDIPHVINFYFYKSNDKVAYVKTQVALEDFEKVDKGFELVISSLELKE